MGDIVEDNLSGSTKKCAYLSKDWVDEYITEMEIQGYTNLAHLGRRFIDTPFIGKSCQKKEQSKMDVIWKRIVMEEVSQVLYAHQEYREIPLWGQEMILKEVVSFAPLGLANKSVYSSINWVDRGIIQIKTLGGKFHFVVAMNFLL